MDPVIYFRGSLAEQEELDAAAKYFRVVQQRTHARKGDLVIPRYSALPWNKELCDDLAEIGAQPINTYRQHCYVADLRNWYYDLSEFTPRTWFALDQIPRDGGPFVIKGATNSKKHLWSTHCFAQDWQTAKDVYLRLAEDTTIGVQPIYIRQYVPLHNLAQGLNGLPISKEFRFFVLDEQIVASGFYWSSHVDEIETSLDAKEVPLDLLYRIIDKVKDKIRFWVMDVAQTETGEWILIELNDGQQSGLSCIEPSSLYQGLSKALTIGSRQ